MKKLIAMTVTILVGLSSMAFALTDVTQATTGTEGILDASAPVNGGKPCPCQKVGYKATTDIFKATEDERKEAEFQALTTTEGATLVPKAPGSGTQ